MDDSMPLKIEDSDDAMDGITALFDDVFIRAIEEGPLEGMSIGPQEGNLVTREGMRTVQSDELCAAEPDPDDADELEDSSEMLHDLERREKPKVLTSDQIIVVNLSNSGETKEVKIGATLPGGALILTEMDGREFSTPVNSDAVKMYFP